ncbi:MAG: lysine 2,3-aminomutase [Planctomycetes bacterium]|nr:lysine 2,3-aminomutase [Planctomycetota bacterium]
MPKQITVAPRPFRVFTRRDLDRIPQLQRLGADERLAMQAVAQVLPFRVNDYVCDELIDWDRVPDDPMFQLTFPQPGMLAPDDLARIVDLLRRGAPDDEVQRHARQIQQAMNPHPAGQVELNVPRLDGEPLPGMQHKYRETVLFFPSSGQTCHTYCTYCFRWPQFVGLDELKFAAREADRLAEYLRRHPEVNSVLFTGGDPMVMKTRVLRRYLEPLLAPELDHIVSIRIGTKAPAYWPHRFTTDADADDLLRLFEQVHAAGRHIAIMAHYSHPRELATPTAQAAVERLGCAGATIRCQAPLIRRVNDDAAVWADLWKRQIVLGAVPYYLFVERDTGPRHYFEVPLARAFEIFTTAYRRVSGLGRTVRGPSMSALPGKVLVDGVADVAGERVFVLKFLQARDPQWVNRVFFARYDETATWLDQLQPAFGESEWWFEPAIRAMLQADWQPQWGDRSRVQKRVTALGHVEWE